VSALPISSTRIQRNLHVAKSGKNHKDNFLCDRDIYIVMKTVTGSGIAQSVWGLGYVLDDLGIGVQFPEGPRDFLFATISRPALGLTQNSCSVVSRGFFPGGKMARV
jgi:hypothetical protein